MLHQPMLQMRLWFQRDSVSRKWGSSGQSRLGDPFSAVFLMSLASWQGQSLWLQRAKGQSFVFLSLLSLSFLLVSGCQGGCSSLPLVSNSLGHVPLLKMEVIASRCGPLQRERMSWKAGLFFYQLPWGPEPWEKGNGSLLWDVNSFISERGDACVLLEEVSGGREKRGTSGNFVHSFIFLKHPYPVSRPHCVK